MKKHIKTQFGRTLVEMIAVIAIIGMIVASGMVLINTAMSTYKTNKFQNQIFTVYQNTISAFRNKADYTGLNNKEAIEKNIIPAEMIANETSGALSHAIGGDFSINVSPAGASFFRMTISDLDEEECVKLLFSLSDEIVQAASVASVSVDTSQLSEVQSACAAEVITPILIDFKTNYFFVK